jgi:hypothetical protein
LATGTHDVYSNSNTTSAYPTSRWTSNGAVCDTCFPDYPIESFTASIPGTYYVFAYWSVSTSSSGPTGGDPKGYAAVNVVAGTSNYTATVTLQ